jgi:phosphoserine phosphatase
MKTAAPRIQYAPRHGYPRFLAYLLALVLIAACPLATLAQSAKADPLPSWNDGPSKKALLDFVVRTTTDGSPDFVKIEDRIATFDNDGTLWVEQPIYTQVMFGFDRIKAMAPQHPEWKENEPFKSVLAGDMKGLEATGEKGLIEAMMTAHVGMTTDEFSKIVSDWIATAQHPRFKRPYTQCVYQPMLELLAFLRANAFETYIVSGGGVEFMRPWTQRVYGIPPQQVVGSSVKTKFEIRNGQPVLLRIPEINFIDDKEGKPIGINNFIGKKPIAAFGNSDGDQQMLEWTAAGKGPSLMLIVHHTDADREYAYDRQSKIGSLDKALDEANAKGWIVVDMKRDWKTIFPAQH